MPENAEIICYSKTGHSRGLAEQIATAMDGHLQIVTTRRYHWPFLSWLTAGRDGWRGASAPLNEEVMLPDRDGLVVLVGPVWAGKPGAPLNTVIDQLGKTELRVAAALTCSNPQEDTAPLDTMESRLGRKLVARLMVSNRRAYALDFAARLNGFVLECRVGVEWQG